VTPLEPFAAWRALSRRKTMDCSAPPLARRRDFLLSAGVFAAGAITPPVLARYQQQQGEKKPQNAEQDEETPPSDDTVAGIAAATFAEAEKLAGVEFTDQERTMMAKTIGEQLNFARSRVKHGFLPNDLAPALRFDPRLPGVTFANGSSSISRSREEPGPLPESDEDIAFAPVAQLSRWIEQRRLTSARLTGIYIHRLKRFDEQLKCVITLCEDHARQQAAEADREIVAGRYRGPLHGIPWGAKDLIDTRGIRTTWGAEPYVERVPDADATVVKKLNDAGAVLVAKLSLGALAYNDIWFGGRTNNPWNLKQGSSGSSAGSAAATAAGLVGFSIGTETYGSITSPCMRCGTTGLRPTFGRVSRSGAMALCWSLDKIGPICRSVEDCMLVLAAINGGDRADPSSIDTPLRFDAQQPLREIRVGYNPRWFSERPATDLDRAALEAAREVGVQLIEIDLPDWPYDSLLNVLLVEAAAAFEELTRTNRDDELTWQEPQAWPNTFRKAWFIPGIEVVQADRFRRQCMMMLAERFAKVDSIIAPSFAASLCLLTNNTGHPSLTLRTGFHQPRENSPEVPYGITLIGRLYDEGTLARFGMALERELNVWSRRPPLS
jgi:Asp-tRNA(Asn)/Glu-tRNA(Gln) amidotransferase A subunit family amidase